MLMYQVQRFIQDTILMGYYDLRMKIFQTSTLSEATYNQHFLGLHNFK